MNRNTLFMLFAFMMILFGCSNQNTAINPNDEMADETSIGSHTIAAAGTFVLDKETGVLMEPSRDLSFHFNVTGFLQSSCPGGCIHIKIIDITDEIWTIEITIENPTSIQVYDVRVIYYNLAGKKVLNPDGYIDLYGKPVSPFTAFAKEYTNRAFPVGPNGKDSEILELLWPAGKPSYVAYLVDVSVGGNCNEPYMIEADISNPIPQSGGNATVKSTVFDWQDSPNDCFLDWRILGGNVVQMPLVGQGTGYRAFEMEIDVAAGYTPGEYPLILDALEHKATIVHLYDIVIAEVTKKITPIKLSGDGYSAFLNFTSKTIGAFGDDVYVVWSDDSLISNKPQIYLKEYKDGMWLDKFKLTDATGDQDRWYNPSIAVNALTGDLHFIWEGYVYAYAYSVIVYKDRRNDVWSGNKTLFLGAFCQDSQLTVENNSEIHIVFQDSDGPFLCLYWIHDPGTGTFELASILAESSWPGDPYYAPAIDHDSEGWVHVPFMSGAGGENNIGYKRYNGTSWSGLTWLTSDYNSFYPDITVAANRKATMIYRKDDNDLWMKTWTGSWETGEHRVTTGAMIFGVPNCDADSNGNVHLAYCGQSDGDMDIYYTMHDESSDTWSAPVNLSDNTSDSCYPSLFVGPDDAVHIVWVDDINSECGVYYLSM